MYYLFEKVFLNAKDVKEVCVIAMSYSYLSTSLVCHQTCCIHPRHTSLSMCMKCCSSTVYVYLNQDYKEGGMQPRMGKKHYCGPLGSKHSRCISDPMLDYTNGIPSLTTVEANVFALLHSYSKRSLNSEFLFTLKTKRGLTVI